MYRLHISVHRAGGRWM